MATTEVTDSSYTVFIRLPFPRGEFIDPPAVDWNTTKDNLLWKILSKASKNSDIDWNGLAEKFDVTLPFLLQQAAWLYEQQLLKVRAQMRKVREERAAKGTATSTDNGVGEDTGRTASGGGGPQAPSPVSGRRDPPIQRNDPSVPNTPIRTTAPSLTRTSSTSTTVQSRLFLPNSTRPTKTTVHRLSITPPRKVAPIMPSTNQNNAGTKAKSPSSSEAAESSSSDSSDSEPAQSRLIRPPRRFVPHKLGRSEDADEDDDSFLPFSTPIDAPSSHQDPSDTLRGDPKELSRRAQGRRTSAEVAQQSQTSDSSASSTVQVQHNFRNPGPIRLSGPISPRRTLELAGRSRANRGKGQGREGSDETPSMGSSFSDLDDASVTQSALEEAFASNMQRGGMASRMSTISQALRSRYL